MNRFETMKQQLKTGVRIETAPLLYPTPPSVAARMVELLDLEQDQSVMEPSAGTGNLLAALPVESLDLDVRAFEIQPRLVEYLKDRFTKVLVKQADFLDISPTVWGGLDRVIMNPPFNGGLDIKHIEYALTFLKPSGRLVALCAAGPRQEVKLRPLSSHWEVLDAGTFKEAGTMVRSVMLVIDKV